MFGSHWGRGLALFVSLIPYACHAGSELALGYVLFAAPAKGLPGCLLDGVLPLSPA